MNKDKVMIGVLASERNMFAWPFIQSLLSLKTYMGSNAVITHVHSGTIPDGRNMVLELAKKHQCDYALMVDSDMTFPAHGAEQLIDSMRKYEASIACGIYFGTYPPYPSTPMAYDEKDGKQVVLDDWKKTRYITSCGMGFTMIDRKLFDIKFEFRPNLGEDHLFCKEARRQAHRIILEPSVKCGHLRLIELNEDLINKLR